MICGWLNLQNPWNRWWTKALKRQGFWYEGGGGACGLGYPRTYPGRGYWGVTVLGNLFRRKDPVLNLSKVVAQSLSHVWLFALQPIRLSCLLLPPRACSNSCPSSRWCHPTISSSVLPFSSRLQSFSESGFFSNESALLIRWSKYWSFSFSISHSNKYSGLISFRMDWLDLLVVQGTLKSLLQHQSSKVAILQHSPFLMVQLSHPYMTTGKTIALTTWPWSHHVSAF